MGAGRSRRWRVIDGVLLVGSACGVVACDAAPLEDGAPSPTDIGSPTPSPSSAAANQASAAATSGPKRGSGRGQGGPAVPTLPDGPATPTEGVPVPQGAVALPNAKACVGDCVARGQAKGIGADQLRNECIASCHADCVAHCTQGSESEKGACVEECERERKRMRR